jgi:hypothetical protein
VRVQQARLTSVIKTIIVDRQRGIFLGNAFGTVPLFSKDAAHTKAYGFQSRTQAEIYALSYLKLDKEDVYFLDVKTASTSHVDVVDIIKSGYHQEAQEMFLHVPTSPTIH